MQPIDIALLAFAAFGVGIHFGAKLEAYNWRSKAKTGFRKESNGKLYSVREEQPWKG